MKIKIDLKNNSALNAALDAVNGKAAAFTVRCALELTRIAAAAERRLEALPKDQRKGAVANYRPAGPSASGYKYAAKSTRVTIERGSSGWFLTAAVSVDVYPKRPESMEITITAEHAAEIQRRAISEFRVHA
jgi:hypothetical protein